MSTTCSYTISGNNNKIWIISKGRDSDIDLQGVVDVNVSGPYKEYEISEIGRYLLNPHPFEIVTFVPLTGRF